MCWKENVALQNFIRVGFSLQGKSLAKAPVPLTDLSSQRRPVCVQAVIDTALEAPPGSDWLF